jgi:signal transduction histidine kinase
LSIFRIGGKAARDLTAGQILQLMGACGLALIVLGTSYLAWSEHRSIAESHARSLSSTAYFLTDHGDRLLEVASIALNTTADAVKQRSWDDIEHDSDLQRQLKATVSGMPHIDDIWLNDATGQLRLTSVAFPTPASNASDRLAFSEAKASHGEMVAGERIVGKVINQPTFLLARRLQDANGKFNGMVSVTADLSYFSDYWSKVKLPVGTVVSLMRATSSEVLVQFPEPPPGDKPKTPRIWGQYSAEPAATRGATFETRTAVLRQLADLPLFISIEAPPDAVLQAWYGWLGMTLPFAGFAFLCLSGLMLAGLMQNRRETATRIELVQAQKRLIEVNAGLENAIAQRTAELTETNEEVQRFAYIVSHDLRAPLINIMGFTSELAALRNQLSESLFPQAAGGRPPPTALRSSGQTSDTDPKADQILLEDFDEALGFIKSSIDKMDRLINAILALSRQGGRRFQIEPIDMNALLHTIADGTAHRLLEVGTDLVIEDLPSLEGDRLAMEQIFSNLIDNAVKYLRKDVPGRITVSARRAGSFIVYLVEDNGRGISPDDHKRIFELFRRSGVQDRQGEGIGLANVKALVRRLGGVVTVESELGAGTVFKVTLPMRCRA